jgi:hypothetical protein
MKDIPDGWVRVADYDERENKSEGGPGGAYAKILAAIKQEPSPIRAYKDGKFWIAMQCDVDDFLQSLKTRSETPTVHAATQDAACHSQLDAACKSLASIDTTLDEIYRVLERLTTAVENIATQPKAEPVGTWRDMNGEVMN